MLAIKGHQSIQDLIADLEDAFSPIGPTPPILMQAARLRDHVFHNTPKQADEKNKVLTVPDSIHLATCLHVRDALGHSDVVFHTFDNATAKGYNADKVVPLLSFETYAKHLQDKPEIAAVCQLPRQLPKHDEPPFL